MSRKASPTIIGAFVLAAIMLAVIGVIALSPNVGEERETYQLYFQGSVKGLDVGAPVLVKGVRVGRVRSISLRMDAGAADQVEYVVPVTVELSERRLLSRDQGGTADVKALIEQGLRAQLELDSFVTQKLFVELGFRPGTEARFYDEYPSEFQQIPTVQTGWQELQAELADVDIVQLVAKASSALDGINRLLSGPETMQTLSSLDQSLRSLDVLLTGLNEDRKVLRESVELTLVEARGALQEMEQLLQDGQVVSEDTRKLVQQIERTLVQTDQVVAQLNALVAEDSPTLYRAEVALDEITGAARAMRQFLELLENQPEVLLRGR